MVCVELSDPVVWPDEYTVGTSCITVVSDECCIVETLGK